MKTIPTFPRYQISDDGLTILDTKTQYTVPMRNNGNGYLIVTLKDNNNNRINQYVHRLVAITYLSNPNNFPIVNHKDENKKNNNVSNLEWCSYTYNNNYGTKTSRMVATKKANNSYIVPKTAIKVEMLDKITG